MPVSGQYSIHRDAVHQALPRLYKLALVLTANEELARALLRGTLKVLTSRSEWQEEDRERLIGPFRRMFSLWSAKTAEDPAIQQRCPPEPRLFVTALIKGPLTGTPQLAKFIAALPSDQRGVLYLVYGEGASYDETAEITGLNVLALMKLLARGHLVLSQWLDSRGIADETTASMPDPYADRHEAA
jgi:RNA polymerase sigma-70 factor, ECF subfamily